MKKQGKFFTIKHSIRKDDRWLRNREKSRGGEMEKRDKGMPEFFPPGTPYCDCYGHRLKGQYQCLSCGHAYPESEARWKEGKPVWEPVCPECNGSGSADIDFTPEDGTGEAHFL